MKGKVKNSCAFNVVCNKCPIVIFIVAILLSGCSSQETVPSKEMAEAADEAKTLWALQKQELPDADEALKSCVGDHEKGVDVLWDMQGDSVYRITCIVDSDLKYQGNCIQKLSAPYKTWQTFPIGCKELIEGDTCYLVKASVEENGRIDMVQQSSSDEELFYLTEWSEDDGYQFLGVSEEDSRNMSDDLQMQTSDITLWKDYQEGKRTEGYLCTTEGVWLLLNADEQEQILSFGDWGIMPNILYCADIDDNNVITILAKVDEKYLLLYVSEGIVSEDKTQLEFALLYADPFLKQAVVAFNKNNEDYEIVLRTPGQGEDYDDFRKRIQAEMSGGGGPALVYDNVIDFNGASQKGILLDMTDNFAKERDSMPDHLQGAGHIGGRYYGVPFRFSVQTLVTSSELVGNRKGWTEAEMIECLTGAQVRAALCGYDSSIVFTYVALGGGLGGKYIDFDTGKSYFDGEGAVSLLETAAKYGDDNGNGLTSGCEDRIADGEVLCSCVNLGGLAQVQLIHGFLQGKEIYIGYPAEDGKSGNIVKGDVIAVNSSCEDSEGAYAFIRYLLSPECQEQIGRGACHTGSSFGFPAIMDSLQNMMEYAVEEQETDSGMYQPVYDSTASIELFKLEPIEHDQLALLYEMLLNARLKENNVDGLFDIILEETPAYFTGGKTAEEVCDIIQNRVQLYLDEN